jgi:general secretion pathway protein C
MKRIFPLINICLITAISFLSIDTLYTMFAAQLDTVERIIPANSPKTFNPVNPANIKSPPLSRYRTIVERDIFHTRKAVNGAADEKIVLENIKPTERDLKLWGTVVGNGSASAYAIIEAPGAKSRRSRQTLYKPGDDVQGATIKKILREKVILSAEGKNEILKLVKPTSAGKFRATRQGYVQPRNIQPIRQKRTLRRSQVQAALSDIDQLQSQARIRSHSEGFQIYRIRRNSIFRRMGLRNGDIITAIGGRAITSVNDAYEIWRDLTAGRDTSVEFKRRGRPRIIDYRIR